MPAGHKTKKTLIREEVDKKSNDIAVNYFVGIVAERGPKIIEKVFDQAEEGCTTSQKLVFDRILPAAKAIDANSETGNLNIQINVGKLERETVEIVEVKGDDDEDGST